MSCNCEQFQACMRDTGICVPSSCSGGFLDRSCQAFDGSKYCASGSCRPRLGNGSRCQPNPVENVCANGLECYRASRMDITGVCQPPGGGGGGGGSRPTNPDPPRPVDPPARPADPPTTPVNPPQPPPSDNNGGGNNSGGGGGSQPPPSNNNGGGSNSGGGGGGANPSSSGGGGNGGNNNGNPGSPSNGSSGTGNGGSTGSGNSNDNSGSPATNNSVGGNSSNGGNNQFPGSNGSSPTAGNNSNSPANPTLPGLAPGSTSSASNSSTIGGVSLPVLVGSVIGAAALGVLIAMLIRRRRKPAQFPPHYPPNYFTQQQDPNDSSPPTLSRVVSSAFKPELQLAATGPEPKPYTRHEPAVDHLVLSTIPRASTHLTPGETAVNLDTEDVQAAPWTGQAVVSTIPRVVEVQLGPGDAELVLPTEFADGTRGMGERDTDTKVHCPTSPTL